MTTSTTPRRPSSTPKRTRKSEEKATDALDTGIRLIVDGTPYEARFGDVTPQLAREIRQRTGHSFRWLMETLYVDPDIDLIGEFVWVARRIAGEDVSIDDVQVSYANLLGGGIQIEQVGSADAQEGDAGPES